VTLDGTWGRSGGVGERLVSYSVNGGALVPVDSGGPVAILSLPAISSPQLVAGRSTTQFLLDTSGGSLASITPTPISGDTGWYDSQTMAKAVFDYSWNSSGGQSRLNAVSYSVDGGEANVLARRGNGTFSVAVTMDAQHQIGIGSVTQYLFVRSGGFDVTLSSPSPTGDGFYDANSSVTVSSSYVGEVVPNQEREALTGYTLDSTAESTPRNDTGTFTAPPIVFDTYHTLVFQSVAQYFVSFAFTDSSGLEQVTPSSFGIDEGALGQQVVPGLSLWMDNGTTFTLSSVVWEGEEVKPLNLSPYQVSAPANVTIDARVYSASMKVSDLFGLAVQGARVAATLVNGTTVTRTTNSSGLVSFGLIPIGPYKASISYLGLATSTSADASIRSEASSTVVASVPFIGLIFAVAVALGIAFVIRRGRARKAQRSVDDEDQEDHDH
ncbi:MAG: carboxypeptidase-like regulatory domain-containing protein, partial [Nitrososphaerales archaeon]